MRGGVAFSFAAPGGATSHSPQLIILVALVAAFLRFAREMRLVQFYLLTEIRPGCQERQGEKVGRQTAIRQVGGLVPTRRACSSPLSDISKHLSVFTKNT